MTDTIENSPPDIGSLTPQQAGELLARMTAAQHAAESGDPSKMTREEAGNALAAMEKAPLPSTDPIGDAIAGKLRNDVMVTSTPESPMLSPYKLNEVVGTFREIGFPDRGIERTLRGTPSTKAEVEWARREKDRAMSNKDFVERYLGGGRNERHWLSGLDVILINGAEEERK